MNKPKVVGLTARRMVRGLVVLLCGLVFVVVLGFVVLSLWNNLMPAIFGLPRLGYFQAIGLLILSRILFGRFGGSGGRWRRRRFVSGWNDLTPDERERFRKAMGDRCPAENP